MVARIALVLLAVSLTAALGAQEGATQVRITPAEITLPIGETATLKAEVLDAGGRPVKADVFFFSRARRSVRVSQDGEVAAIAAGTFEVVARSMIDGERGPEGTATIIVPQPQPAKVAIEGAGERMFTGTSTRVTARVLDDNDTPRDDLEVELRSSAPGLLMVGPFGEIAAVAPGRATLIAKGGGLVAHHPVEVVANPATSIDVEIDRDALRLGELTEADAATAARTFRTGDVVRFRATPRSADGEACSEVPVHWSFVAHPDDSLGNGATGQIESDGRFVAETPGLYTIVADCGTATARLTIRAEPRFDVERRLVEVGHGPVLDTHTSDLWVWEGVDGRDYAVTGTWGANGDAHFWDVTDPSRIERIATHTVDARTVNDVKVSEDGRLCIISREGASNRKNGLVILDVTDPRQPKRLSTFDDELTGGVHNLYIDRGYVYALSAGRRYDVIDIQKPENPTRVGSFQLFEPGASIHDVWVNDGIAFSSNWRYGLRLVDVGNGIAGGSPSNPVEFANYAYPSGWNHAAFPWRSPDTNRFYVVAGDEAFPYGLHVKGKPTYPRGWIHFVDFTDFENPDEVARYEVPEAGTHNMWIDGDTMYVAYYNGGLRVVDISGELLGDLYRQGREIAWFLPTVPAGLVPNAPMVWGPQPHKGHIFFSDWNSGLWAVKLEEVQRRRRG